MEQNIHEIHDLFGNERTNIHKVYISVWAAYLISQRTAGFLGILKMKIKESSISFGYFEKIGIKELDGFKYFFKM
jgi:hypothetical protein